MKLRDGDVIRLGKTAIRFRDGVFVGPSGVKTPGIIHRPTRLKHLPGRFGILLFSDRRSPPRNSAPSPRPAPKEPDAYSSDAVRQMVSELVSSSWDSIYENASRPDR